MLIQVGGSDGLDGGPGGDVEVGKGVRVWCTLKDLLMDPLWG